MTDWINIEQRTRNKKEEKDWNINAWKNKHKNGHRNNRRKNWINKSLIIDDDDYYSFEIDRKPYKFE